MIIAIQNTIGAIGRGLGIVTRNLQMWLGFTKADVLGVELVVDGDFPLPNTYWITGIGWSISGGSANYDDSSTSSNTTISTSVSLDSTKQYELTFITANTSTTGEMFFQASGGGVDSMNGGYKNYASGTHTFYFNVSSNRSSFKIYGKNGLGDFSISNISVKEVAQFIPDKSNNSNNAKLFTGKALSFDGVNDYIENSSMLTASKNASTLSFSIKNTGSSGGEGFIGNSTTNQHYLSISSSNLILRASGTMVFSYSFSLNTWYRISIVRFDDSGTSKTSIYVDDVLTSTIVNEFDFQFNRFGESTSGSYGKVLLSDIQLYNTAWTSDDVAFDYANPNNLVFNNSASSISVSNLKGYYALSEGSGSIAYDSSGEGNNGAITGATYDDKQPTIPQLGMMDWSNASGKTLIEAPKNIGYDILGNALRLRDGGFNLDGIGYAEVASNSSLTNITGGTIQFWLKTSDTKFSVLNGQSSSEFIGKTDNGVWSFGNAGTITSYIGSDTASTQPLYNDAWNFYTFTGVNLSTWNEFYTSNLAGFDIDGIIDEVLIYSSVLSAKEIKNNYKIGLSKHS